MSQTSNTAFDNFSSNPSKSPDFILAIAGWPTLYSCFKDDYTLAGDLANFTEIKAWMNVPSGAGAKVKDRPENGKTTIGQMDVEIQDRMADGARAISRLMSRQAYVEGTSSGTTTALSSAGQIDLTRTATTINVDDTTGIVANDVIHIGLEAIKVGSVASSTQFTGCTRGYLLTDATAHQHGVKVYAFMPSLYRRPAYLFKGYRDLGLASWLKAFGGPIVGESKSGQTVTLEVMSQSWEMYRDGSIWIIHPWDFGRLGEFTRPVLPEDFADIQISINDSFRDFLLGSNNAVLVFKEHVWTPF